ncbi:unnamed protein product [Protopolystoma xenopodis]|uniref:Uncharacterized protein n=1 Tax=Protopolystoma xenopodis TaxID=117903 RepID=A0A3S5BFA9_9PLAT|nr:unnamed protein product [Protopolystoma xenopodis]
METRSTSEAKRLRQFDDHCAVTQRQLDEITSILEDREAQLSRTTGVGSELEERLKRIKVSFLTCYAGLMTTG